MKTVLILRSVSGAGKSTFAEFISSLNEDCAICCADDYFMKEGEYQFDAKKLGEAHDYCRDKFEEEIDKSTNTIIVANTNTAPKEFSFYEEFAEEFGYRVFHLIIENRHGGENIHRVPAEVTKRQEDKLRNNIKLQ